MSSVTKRRIRKITASQLGIVPASITVALAKKKPLAGVGENRIYYGAPGTGKSHAVDEMVGEVNVVRTVFHPDTQNSDFFGCLKPQMVKGSVDYRFSPGPFSEALCAAYGEPAHQHFLVIEELNRAAAAAVFGELFQLLDRNDDGSGKYKVNFPNAESRAWFEEKLGAQMSWLRMPSNLSIFATMNSADQGVFPLDTAFRRRWEQEYVPLYGDVWPIGNINFISTDGNTQEVEWHVFVRKLNEWLSERYEIQEDRLLGYWFVKEKELGGEVPSKILLYLWDDLLRHEARSKTFAPTIKNFSDVSAAIKGGRPVFDASFIDFVTGSLGSKP